MDSIFEKITLYDILGYFIPGSLVVIAVCGKFIQDYQTQTASLYSEFKSLFVYGFILLSLICGLLISEVSRKFLEWIKKNAQIDFPLPEQIIKRALVEANIVNENENIDVKDYNKQIYGDIQSDKDYKRIHNYASAEVMCKNLAFASLISALIACNYIHNGLIVVGGILCGVVFLKRYERFGEKKQEYAIIWYAEKYLGKKSEEKIEKQKNKSSEAKILINHVDILIKWFGMNKSSMIKKNCH